MAVSMENKLVIAISSRALFNLEESNRIYDEEGLENYIKYQINHENEPLQPGVAFSLIKRLLALGEDDQSVEVILVSRNDANTGVRVFNSIEHHGLNITRAAFAKGRSPYKYLQSFKADLFLSANPEDVRLALAEGYASATILEGLDFQDDQTNELRIAFDGDAVLFSDEAERVFAEEGLEVFKKSEADNAQIPLNPGPFKNFLEALNKIQQSPAHKEKELIRTALVTARNAPSHKRAIMTLRAWGITIDEVFFLGGVDKSKVLEAFRPHIFFDDQTTHCIPASSIVPTGHVPAGIRNKDH